MRLGAAHMTINTSHQRLLLSLTQENAVDLHNVGSSLTLPAMVGRKKYRSCQKQAKSSFHCSQLVRCYIYNKPKVKFMPFCKDTEHYIKLVYYVYITCNKRDWTLATCTCNWNTSVTGHKQERVGFFQGKNLPNSTASSSVSINNKLTHSHNNSNTDMEKTVSSKTLISVYLNTDRHINSILNAYGQ